MASTRRERRGGYSGPAELLIDGEKRADVTVRLHGYVDLLGEGANVTEGLKSWDGVVEGLGLDVFFDTIGKMVTVRTPDGREGAAILRNDRGALGGSGLPPFDL